MNKLINYLKNAAGFGIKYLLLFSCLAALILTVFFNISQKNLPNRLQQTADQLLPLKIENGRIVNPDNTFKNITFDLFDNAAQNEKMIITLNTTVDSLDPTKLKPGVYISRTAIYTVAPRQTRTTFFSSSFDIPAGDYRSLFQKALTYVDIIIFITMAVVFFVISLLFSLFYAFCTGIIALIFKKKLAFDLRMRLSVFSLIVLNIISFLIAFIGLDLSGWKMFIAMLAFLGFLSYKIPVENRQE